LIFNHQTLTAGY